MPLARGGRRKCLYYFSSIVVKLQVKRIVAIYLDSSENEHVEVIASSYCLSIAQNQILFTNNSKQTKLSGILVSFLVLDASQLLRKP